MTTAAGKRVSALLSSLALAIAGSLVSITTAGAAGPDCQTIFSRPMHGAEAVAALGANLPAVAALNMQSAAGIKRMLEDPTFWLDQCGRGFYVEEPVAAAGTVDPAAAGTSAVLAPLDQTFLLHSKPDANVRIYLDFDGMYVTASAWLSYAGTTAFTAPAYSMDSDPAFSDTEKTEIQRIWQRVSEDYSAFNIDVTTEQPPASDLQRTDSSDTRYGTTALITNDSVVFNRCGCGGVAYVGVFDTTGTAHESYQPAWVFTKGVGTGSKYVAEATSHEVGHNLGLSHDGLANGRAGYYYGANGWAPIMGVGYYVPVVHWSKGEYPDANQTQDDFAVMASHGAVERVDEDSNNAATARPIDFGTTGDGVISSPTDSDWFSFTPATSGGYYFNATPAALSPNLDIKLELYDGTTLLGSADQPMSIASGDIANGLDANIGWNLTGGNTYYLKLSGVGFRTLASGGYSDYGSLGQYSVMVASGTLALSHLTSTSMPSATVNNAYNRAVPVTGGVQPYSFSATGLPGWATLTADGRITGTPTTTGASTVNVTVTDSNGSSASRSFTLSAVAAPSISTSSIPEVLVGASYSLNLAVSGGASSFMWMPTAALPGSMTLSKAGALGGGAPAAGLYSVSFQVTDFNGVTANKTFPLFVASSALTITSASLPDAMQDTPYSTSVAASGGGGSYTWSATGLPTGLSISSGGIISGTPTATGVYPVSLRVADPYGATATVAINLNVTAPSVSITTDTLPTTTATANYSQSLVASGATGSVSWAASGLPGGISLDGTSGALTGAATVAGSYAVTFTATDSATSTAVSKTITLTVVAAPSVTTSTLTAANLNTAYSATLAAAGGVAPYSWTISGLPAGLTYSVSTGAISGSPTVSGSFNLTVTVQEANGVTATKSLSLSVAAPALSITTSTLPNARSSKSYSTTLSATGGSGTRSWTVIAGALPAGMTLSSSGVLSSTRVTATKGTYNFTVQVTDSAGVTTTKQFSIKVQ